MSFSDIVLGNVLPSVHRLASLQISMVVVTIEGFVFRDSSAKQDKTDTAIPCHEFRCVTPFKPKIVVVCFVADLVPDTVKQEDVFVVFHHFKDSAAPIKSSP